jgi:hypothetical protein
MEALPGLPSIPIAALYHCSRYTSITVILEALPQIKGDRQRPQLLDNQNARGWTDCNEADSPPVWSGYDENGD